MKDAPRTIEGGHLFFSIRANEDLLVCAAFEPTKNFRDSVKKLVPGDLIDVYGAVKERTLNLEKLEVLELADKIAAQAPLCPSCGKRMKSAGRGQGYRCRRCKLNAEQQEKKALTERPRDRILRGSAMRQKAPVQTTGANEGPEGAPQPVKTRCVKSTVHPAASSGGMFVLKNKIFRFWVT